jgi:hypothetical protein
LGAGGMGRRKTGGHKSSLVPCLPAEAL